MIDYAALMKARSAPDHATPPARMSGGDRPMWDADMGFWMDDVVFYGDGYGVSFDRSKLSILSSPRYKCADAVAVSGAC